MQTGLALHEVSVAAELARNGPGVVEVEGTERTFCYELTVCTDEYFFDGEQAVGRPIAVTNDALIDLAVENLEAVGGLVLIPGLSHERASFWEVERVSALLHGSHTDAHALGGAAVVLLHEGREGEREDVTGTECKKRDGEKARDDLTTVRRIVHGDFLVTGHERVSGS